MYNINTFIHFCRFVGFDIISYLHNFRLFVLSLIVRRPEFICSRGCWLDDNWVPYLRGKLCKSKCLYLSSETCGSNTAHCLADSSQRSVIAT